MNRCETGQSDSGLAFARAVGARPDDLPRDQAVLAAVERPDPAFALAIACSHRADARFIAATRNVWLSARWEGAALLRGVEVRRGGALIDLVGAESYCVAENGRLVSHSGRNAVAVGTRTVRG